MELEIGTHLRCANMDENIFWAASSGLSAPPKIRNPVFTLNVSDVNHLKHKIRKIFLKLGRKKKKNFAVPESVILSLFRARAHGLKSGCIGLCLSLLCRHHDAFGVGERGPDLRFQGSRLRLGGKITTTVQEDCVRSSGQTGIYTVQITNFMPQGENTTQEQELAFEKYNKNKKNAVKRSAPRTIKASDELEE